jgi:uncharacterized delta-60 repeat protein
MLNPMRRRCPTGPGLLTCALALAVAAACAAGPSSAATASSTVGATVLSATYLDASMCETTDPGAVFGPVTTSSSTVIGTDCRLTFGSSNDTSSLRLQQSDGAGAAMWRLPDGTLDTTFQGDGIGDATADTTSPSWSRGGGWTVRPDGTAYVASTGPSGTRVYRYTAAGALDTAWNGTGKLDWAAAGLGGAVGARSDGKVYVAGVSGSTNLVVGRFLADGTPDPSCGGTGSVTVTPPAGQNTLYTTGPPIIVDETRGRVLVAVGSSNASDNDAGVVVLRDSDCAPDTTFSGDGVWLQDLGDYEAATGVLERADGSVTVVISQSTVQHVAQLTSAGVLDTGFSGDGLFEHDPGGLDLANAGVYLPDGRLIVAAQTAYWPDDSLVQLTAVLPDGTVDPTWGSSGSLDIDVSAGEDKPFALAVDSAGRVLVVGTTDDTIGVTADSFVARVRANGVLDASFDGDGVRTLALSGARGDVAEYVTEGIDGRVLVGAHKDLNGTDDRFVPVRFATTPVTPYVEDTTDWLTGGTGLFGACLRATTGTAAWTANATCDNTAATAPWWNAVPTAPVTVATEAVAGNVTADLRFGFRTLGSQPAGTYLAPITFQVVAPAV